MIELKITRFDKNKKYEEQLKEWKRNNGPYGGAPIPDETYTNSVLNIEISEEQFDAIRKAVLEVF